VRCKPDDTKRAKGISIMTAIKKMIDEEKASGNVAYTNDSDDD